MIIDTRLIPQDIQPTLRRDAERSAVLALLAKHLGQAVELAHSEEGKPYLPDFPETHISISHTHGCVALALSTDTVGIDLEKLGERAERVATRILPPKLLRAIGLAPPKLRHILYYLAWTSGEALYKLVEESQVITDFEYLPSSLSYDEGLRHLGLQALYKPKPERPLYIDSYNDGEYMLTIATEYERNPLHNTALASLFSERATQAI